MEKTPNLRLAKYSTYTVFHSYWYVTIADEGLQV
jgi:hypothetical protein